MIICVIGVTTIALSMRVITVNLPRSYERPIILIAVHMDLNYNEVCQINYTSVANDLSLQNFSFHMRTNNTIDPDLKYWAKNLDGCAFGMIIAISQNVTTRKAWLDVTHTSAIQESELQQEKNYIITRTNIILKTCNLTENWHNAVWSISYQD
jgi:hypothetical protein